MDLQLLYKKSLRGPLQIISYFMKVHCAGPSVNVDIFLAKVKIVRLQIFSYYIKRHSTGPIQNWRCSRGIGSQKEPRRYVGKAGQQK